MKFSQSVSQLTSQPDRQSSISTCCANTLPLFIINDINRTDRKNKMIYQLLFLNQLNYTFFNAITSEHQITQNIYNWYLNLSTFKNIDNIYLPPKRKKSLNLGSIGLILSTFKLYEKINDMGLDFVIILEDDVKFNKNYNQFINDLVIIKSIDIIYLGINSNKNKWCELIYNYDKPIYSLSKIKDNNNIFWGTYGYICNRKFRDTLLSYSVHHIVETNQPLDCFFWYLHFNSNISIGIVSGEHFFIPELTDPYCIQGKRCESLYSQRWKYLNINNYNL
jgi:GR25 family glycosyltransferase involved in LPS biosynthesis